VRRLAATALAALALVPGCAFAPKPAWELPPPPTRDAPVVPEGALHRTALDNGVKVLVLEDRRLPRITLGVTVRRGDGAVPVERAGLAGFTAEVMSRGAGTRGALALAQATDEIGASLDVGSGWDSMTVQVGGLSRDLDRLLGILADVALRPRFEAGEARKARGEILAALEQAKDDPATLARWHLLRVLYDGHPYGAPDGGLPETVSRFEARDAREFHRGVFVPNDAILFAVGDVDTEALLPKLVAAFGAWRPAEPVDPGPPPPAQVPVQRRIAVVDRPDLGQARILLAHEGIARSNPDRIGAGLLNTVLGGGAFSSRLIERLRVDEGLTYGVGSGFSMRRYPGPFSVSTFTRVAEVRRTLDLTLAELERIRTDPPHGAELKGAKAQLVGRFSLGLESSAAVMSSLVDLEIYGLPEDSLDTYRGRVRAVTTDDAARLARELIHPERVAIVLVGPAEAIVPQVEDLGPVEVVKP
jgi:zinc protease